MKKFLANNTQTFISLFSKIQEGVVIHAQDTSIIYANPAATRILGLTEDELLGKTATNHDWSFIDEEYEKIAIEDYPVNKLFHSKEIIEHQIMGIYSSVKEIKWIDVNGSITIDEDGEKRALILIQDITKDKDAYEKIELFKHLVDVVDTGITISDPSQEDSPLIYVNKTFEKITGYIEAESVGKNCRFLQREDREQDALQTIRDAIKNQTSCEVELRNYTKEGKLFHNLLNITPLYEKKKLKYFIGVQHDITKQKQQKELLEEKNLYIQSILNAQTGMVFVNDSTKIIFANQALYDFFGVRTLEEFLQKHTCICHFFLEHDSYFHLGLVQENENWVDKVNELPQNRQIVCLKGQNQKLHYFKISTQEILNKKHVITLNSITDEIEKQQLLTSKAYHDPLTGAFNRQYFYEYLLPEIAKSKRNYGVIMSDIDHFKSINDTYGHGVGDEVIKVIVQTLQSSLRLDDAVMRWGGEEFISIVAVKSLQEATNIAQSLKNAVENITLENVRKFTSSFGVTLLSEGENIDVAIQRADEALYKAKENGRNRVETK